MKTIYKYELTHRVGVNKIEMPKRAKILSVQVQNGVPCIWALVDNENEKEEKAIMIIGTGQPMPYNPTRYIGTYQIWEGALVYHVFELIK